MFEISDGPTPLRSEGDYEAWLFTLDGGDEQAPTVEFHSQIRLAQPASSHFHPASVERGKQRGSPRFKLSSRGRTHPRKSSPEPSVSPSITETATSPVGRQPPQRGRDAAADLDALVERNKIRVSMGKGVECIYEFSGTGWFKLSLQNDHLVGHREPRTLAAVHAELQTEEQCQEALNIDPKGAAGLSAR